MRPIKRAVMVERIFKSSEKELREILDAIYNADPDFVERIAHSIASPIAEISVPLTDAISLEYPCTAYACFDYSATGEGRTLGLIVMSARSSEDLTRKVIQEFGEFYAGGVTVGYWRGTPLGFEPLDPRIALKALEELFVVSPAYCYSAKLHYNAA